MKETESQRPYQSNSSSKPFGSGHFGEWITDEFDLPAFRYTCDQTRDPKAISPTDPVFRSPTDQTHQVGNDRLVAAVSNYGYVQVRQDEGSPKFLNDYSPSRSQFGGGVGYLTDGRTALSTFYDGRARAFERIFGIGYFRKKVSNHAYAVDQVIFAPFGDDPVLVSQVTIANHSESAAELRWIEYWGCQVYQFSYRSWLQAVNRSGIAMQGSWGKAVDLRRRLGDRFSHEFRSVTAARGLIETKHYLGRTAEDERLWQRVQDATSVLAPNPAPNDFVSIQGALGRASMEDLHPPDTFLASLDGPVDRFATDGKAFFGAGGVAQPSSLNEKLSGELGGGGNASALLLEKRMKIEPGESRTLSFLYGYLPAGIELEPLVQKYREDPGHLWANSSARWKTGGLCLATPAEPWVERELTWSYYYLRSNLTFDDFFSEHILSQSGEYQYTWGFQAAARDPLQHALPFVFTDPEVVKSVLRYTLKEVRPNGSVPYGIVGHGMQMPTSQDNSSDQAIWLLWLASEYVLATRDAAFLDEEIPTNMVCGPSTGTESIRNVLARCYRYLVESVGAGPHKLMRMLMDDWNDGLVYQAVPEKRRAEYIRGGESVLNSAMVSYVFELYAKLLDFTGGGAMCAASARQKAEEHRQAVRAQWTGRWFPRAWLGPRLGWLGIDNLWLGPQPWAIIGGVTTPEQNRSLVRAIDEYLRRPSPTAAMLWSPAGHKPDPGGSDEIDLSPNGWLIWSLALVDGAMAWDAWKRNSLAMHAEVFPDVWYGVWSGSDGYDGPSSKFLGRESPSPAVEGTGTNDWSVVDFPVMNMHSHAWPLYSASKLLATEFTPEGVSMRADLPLETFRFASPLLGLEKSQQGYRGWYAPHGKAGAWRVTVHLPNGETQKITAVEVNGRAHRACTTSDGSVCITGKSHPGEPLRWLIRFSAAHD